MITAEEAAIGLEAVSDDANAAVLALWREHVDRALEAVERVLLTAVTDGERLVVVVAAVIADGHGRILGCRSVVGRAERVPGYCTPKYPGARMVTSTGARASGACPG